MPPTNDFIPFCPTDTGTNLLSEADYAAAADRISGNKPGVASAKLNNKALRQSTAVAAGVASLVSLITGASTLDDGDAPKLYGQIASALTAFPPVITSYLSGTGSHLLTFIFSIASGSATAGATYTNNGFTFTVKQTVASGLVLKATGTGSPAVSGALTKTAGTGDATIVFYAVRAPVVLRARMVGGGASGTGSGSGPSNTGNPGNDTTFGSSLLVAGGGLAPPVSHQGGVGGSASLGSGPVGVAIAGGYGIGADSNGVGFASAGSGGSSAFGGAGGTQVGGAGFDAATNSGSGGGGGGGSAAAGYPGAGGGAGGFVDALIYSPSASYPYAVGTGGAAGSAGASGQGSGAGADGLIEITEFYQ